MNNVKVIKLDEEASDCQAAVFLACVGSEAYKLYTTMDFTHEQDKEDPIRLLEALATDNLSQARLSICSSECKEAHEP